MKKWLNARIIVYILICGVLAAELLLLIDAVVVFLGKTTPIVVAMLLLTALMLLIVFLFRRRVRLALSMAIGIPVVLVLTAYLAYAGWCAVGRNAGYEFPDSGKHQIYGDRRVMVIVPHQDDEWNILGGVMDEYVRYGSEIYAVFVTNGDYEGLAETRFQEAVDVFADIGVPEDHVIFLGYGNEWVQNGVHIYNAKSDMVLQSYIGRTKTYGTKVRPAYRENRDYTIDHLTEDLKSVVLEYRPDVIFCSDYDHHIDHRATSLLFDKAMGQILKENREYKPVVYKAYAYGTAWEAEPDYYADHILSTRNLFEAPYSQRPAVYRWEERVRFPVDGAALSHSLVHSDAYRQLSLYKSQGTKAMASAVINGDKVAWRRNTDSLCLHAAITVSSGNAGLLNDFMLIENNDLVDRSHMPYDGVWIPEQGDSEKKVTVTLDQKSDVFSIVLYDHPSETDNILSAVITFDDGAVIKTGPLDPGGAATSVTVEKEDVTSFCVSILETEGELAGLSELEAFKQESEPDGRFVKLMDPDGNFLYDFCTEPDGVGQIMLYMHGDLPELAEEHYSVGVEEGTGTACLENGVIHVCCPSGEKMVLNVACNQLGVSDSIVVRNPGSLERWWDGLWQDAEAGIYSRYRINAHRRLLLPYTIAKIAYVLRHMG